MQLWALDGQSWTWLGPTMHRHGHSGNHWDTRAESVLKAPGAGAAAGAWRTSGIEHSSPAAGVRRGREAHAQDALHRSLHPGDGAGPVLHGGARTPW